MTPLVFFFFFFFFVLFFFVFVCFCGKIFSLFEKACFPYVSHTD